MTWHLQPVCRSALQCTYGYAHRQLLRSAVVLISRIDPFDCTLSHGKPCSRSGNRCSHWLFTTDQYLTCSSPHCTASCSAASASCCRVFTTTCSLLVWERHWSHPRLTCPMLLGQHSHSVFSCSCSHNHRNTYLEALRNWMTSLCIAVVYASL